MARSTKQLFDQVGETVGHRDRRASGCAAKAPLRAASVDNRAVARSHTPRPGRRWPTSGTIDPVRAGNEADQVLGRQRLARERTGPLGGRLVGGVASVSRSLR